MRNALLPTVADLTLEQKIGQMLCLGWGGAGALCAINEQARRCVGELGAGGMIVMGRNVAGPGAGAIDAGAVRAMLAQLQERATVPLLVGTDQEGGRVARFGAAPFTRMPPALTIGEQSDTNLARAAARATGRELKAVGVNWNFAPVADINSNPDNPVIGDRSFGDNPERVAEMVAAQVAGYTESGVLACAKHFPGHGDTSLDSHYDLPTVGFDLPQMTARELIPFRAAIDAGVPSVMTAHILFPALEPGGLPATMSRAILTGLLRESMGFDGLIVTDCLEMKAVADGWGTARAAVLAACAGADMLLVCHTWEQQKATFDALMGAVQTGELPLTRVDDAVARVLRAKQIVAAGGAAPDLTVIGSAEHQVVRAAFGGGNTPAGPTTLGAEAPR